MKKEKIRQVGSINFSNCNSERPSPTLDPPLAVMSPSYGNEPKTNVSFDKIRSEINE